MVTVHLLTVLLASLAVIMSMAGFSGSTIHRSVIRRWARWVTATSFIRVHATGLERIDPRGGPYIVVMNHQSLLDIPIVVAVLPLQLRFIGKIELSVIPIFGAAARRCGHIFIDRKDHEGSIDVLREATGRIFDERISIVVAPEGTRSPDGLLLPFKKGAFVTAISLGVPVLPVVVRGTRDAVPKGKLGSFGGDVDVIVEEPISTAGMVYDDRDMLSQQVRKMMERHLR